jgi:hypothetical protein
MVTSCKPAAAGRIEVWHILLEEIRLIISSNNQGTLSAGHVLFGKQESNGRFFLFRVCLTWILQDYDHVLLGPGSSG